MELDRLHAFAQALIDGQELAGEDRDRRWMFALSAVRDLLGPAYCSVGVRTGDRVVRTILVGSKLYSRPAIPVAGIGAHAPSAGLVENRLRPGTPFRHRADGCPRIRVAGFAYHPIPRQRGGAAWLLLGRTAGGPKFQRAQLPWLGMAARALGVLLDNESLLGEFEHLAMTDALTHIPNYRFLRLTLDRELARAVRHGEIFSVVMVDVDNLKKYNADHGHLGGSELLQQVAQVLQREIRATDVVAKYGGDEFLLILPRTDVDGGRVLSERIRRGIATSLRGRSGEVLSCSFGVAGCPQDGQDFESLISAADHALFVAKNEGRNQVVATEAIGSASGAASARVVTGRIPRGTRRTKQKKRVA